MNNTEKLIFNKTVTIEKLIAGLWYNPINGVTWQFSNIEPCDRRGNLMIADTSTPVRGLFLNYEIIWVDEDNVFMDIIYSSIPKTYKHQIWLSGKALRISFVNCPNFKTEVLVLNKC